MQAYVYKTVHDLPLRVRVPHMHSGQQTNKAEVSGEVKRIGDGDDDHGLHFNVYHVPQQKAGVHLVENATMVVAMTWLGRWKF